MKRFHELNKDQQEQAVQHASRELHSLMLQGVIVTDRTITKAEAREMAESAAEYAWYSERNDMIVADIADGK